MWGSRLLQRMSGGRCSRVEHQHGIRCQKASVSTVLVRGGVEHRLLLVRLVPGALLGPEGPGTAAGGQALVLVRRWWGSSPSQAVLCRSYRSRVLLYGVVCSFAGCCVVSGACGERDGVWLLFENCTVDASIAKFFFVVVLRRVDFFCVFVVWVLCLAFAARGALHRWVVGSLTAGWWWVLVCGGGKCVRAHGGCLGIRSR